MEKTEEDQLSSEKYLDEAAGDLAEAFVIWMKTSFGKNDYDTLFGLRARLQPFLRENEEI